jgi:hypothetical protein
MVGVGLLPGSTADRIEAMNQHDLVEGEVIDSTLSGGLCWITKFCSEVQKSQLLLLLDHLRCAASED